MHLSDIVAALGGELVGLDLEVDALAPLDQAGRRDIGFLADRRHLNLLAGSEAGAVIVDPSLRKVASQPGRSLILSDDPYLYAARLGALIHPPRAPRAGIHPSAVVAGSARIAPSAEIGPMVCLGERAVIGERCRLQAGVVIGDDVALGDDVLLHPRVVVQAGARLGHRVIVQAGAVIGSDGFGLAWAGDRWEKIHHQGGVSIGDDVEIGANTTIDRGTLSDTRIADDVRIDNLVQVAHNVEIGAHTAIAACTGIAGSTRIGARCRIGGAAMFVGQIHVADGTVIGGGTLVSKSVRQADHFASSFPFLSRKDWVANAVHLRHLDRLVSRVRAVELSVRDLQVEINGDAPDPVPPPPADDAP